MCDTLPNDFIPFGKYCNIFLLSGKFCCIFVSFIDLQNLKIFAINIGVFLIVRA